MCGVATSTRLVLIKKVMQIDCTLQLSPSISEFMSEKYSSKSFKALCLHHRLAENSTEMCKNLQFALTSMEKSRRVHFVFITPTQCNVNTSEMFTNICGDMRRSIRLKRNKTFIEQKKNSFRLLLARFSLFVWKFHRMFIDFPARDLNEVFPEFSPRYWRGCPTFQSEGTRCQSFR